MNIHGGDWRGRPLAVPRGSRPTSARTRAALFSALGSQGSLVGALVLDTFAGSGALGLEALSRGASHAFFIERSPLALTRNIAALGAASRATLIGRDALKPPSPPAQGTPVSLIFLDPPWAMLDAPAAALSALLARGWLSPTTRIVLEQSARVPPLAPPSFTVLTVRDYGDTRLVFLSAPAVPQPSP